MNYRFSKVLESRKQNRALKLTAYYILLVFAAEGSAKCILDDGTELPNGAVFALRK